MLNIEEQRPATIYPRQLLIFSYLLHRRIVNTIKFPKHKPLFQPLHRQWYSILLFSSSQLSRFLIKK